MFHQDNHKVCPESLSILFPCYNDGGTIGSLIISAIAIAKPLFDDFEIVVVDDGSKDNSALILDELKQKYINLKIITHEKNSGYGAALNSGFHACTKEFIFYTDGDAQYDVFELPNLLEALELDTDIVNGYKVSRADPYYRILIGKLYNFINKKTFHLNIKDIDCDFRLIRKSFLNKLNLHASGGEICVELIAKAQKEKAKFKEIQVSHYHRVYGKSQFFSVKNIIRTARGVLKLRKQLKGNT